MWPEKHWASIAQHCATLWMRHQTMTTRKSNGEKWQICLICKQPMCRKLIKSSLWPSKSRVEYLLSSISILINLIKYQRNVIEELDHYLVALKSNELSSSVRNLRETQMNLLNVLRMVKLEQAKVLFFSFLFSTHSGIVQNSSFF